MDDCIFCKIVNKEIDADIVLENESAMVFKDLNPKAPVHLLAVPKKHVASIMEIDRLSPDQVHQLLKAIADIAGKQHLEDGGFRVVANTGASAGQSVEHLHFHILGKRDFSWPPG